MEPGRWQTFLKWLHNTGLLTDATASRAPVRSRHSPLLVVEGHLECDRNLSIVERVQCEVRDGAQVPVIYADNCLQGQKPCCFGYLLTGGWAS